MATTAVPADEKDKGKVRVTLDVTPAMKDVLDRLAEESGITQAEVLRRAVAVLNAIKKAEARDEGEPALVKNGAVVYKLVGF